MTIGQAPGGDVENRGRLASSETGPYGICYSRDSDQSARPLCLVIVFPILMYEPEL